MRTTSAGTWAVLALGVAATVACAWVWQLSLAWPTLHDLPIMLYLAMLWDRFGALPHTGFFDMNVLGSYLSYLAIGRAFGYDPVAIRWADLAVFSVIAALSVAALRRVDWIAGWVAAALFGIAYLHGGSMLSLQREYLMLVPVLVAVVVAVRERAHPGTRAFIAGLAIGAAMTIKPQALIGALPIGLFLAAERRGSYHGSSAPPGTASWVGRAAVTAAAMTAGIGIVLAALLGALAWLGVVGSFWDIATGYLPLYGDLTGAHVLLPPAERLAAFLASWSGFGSHYGWLLAAVIGCGSCWLSVSAADPTRRLLGLFAGMAAAFAVYPALSGKFWPYHWLPMLYWLVVCASLALARIDGDSRWGRRRLAAGIAAGSVFWMFPGSERSAAMAEPVPEHLRSAHQISDFLRPRLLPGDTVQPLDWTRSAVVHGLLLAEAELATSFVYDFHFYHHVSSDYIRRLRRRFLRELDASNARFVIRGKMGPHPSGVDTSRRFPGLEQLLAAKYQKIIDTRVFAILERRDTPTAADGSEDDNR